MRDNILQIHTQKKQNNNLEVEFRAFCQKELCKCVLYTITRGRELYLGTLKNQIVEIFM